MKIVNRQVFHRQYGKGTVAELSDTLISVRFSCGIKQFLFPDAFESYLSMIDKDADAYLNEILKSTREKKNLETEKEERATRKQTILKNMKLHPCSQAAFRCEAYDKSTLFRDWRVFTGTVKTGLFQGCPNRPVRLHQNSACLLTCREPGMKEKDRYILGVYMVGENFIGSSCEDGYVPAHSELRLWMSGPEAKRMLFWRYYMNERFPENITWNSGEYRYFYNAWMAVILKDITKIKKGSRDGELADRFLRYFCRINQIREDAIPEPNGALSQIASL